MSNMREVHPQEERLAALGLPFDVVDSAVGNIVVDRSLTLWSAPGVADGLLTDPAEARVECRTIPVGRLAVQRSPTRRTSQTAGLIVICLPQVWAEHLVLDVPWPNTKLDQGAADLLHEGDRSAQVIHRIVRQADLR